MCYVSGPRVQKEKRIRNSGEAMMEESGVVCQDQLLYQFWMCCQNNSAVGASYDEIYVAKVQLLHRRVCFLTFWGPGSHSLREA